MALKDKEILQLLLKAEYRRKQSRFMRNRIALAGILNGLPSFSMEMRWSCNESPILTTHGLVQSKYYKVLPLAYQRYTEEEMN
jgi:hypothetical protein